LDILITGKLSSLNREAVNPLASTHKVACAADDLIQGQFGSNVTPFRVSPRDPDFEKIIQSYHFEAVLFFSEPMYLGDDTYSEFDALERCLRLCARHNINRVLFFYPNIHTADHKNELSILYESCLHLCAFYRSHMAMSVVTAAVPNIYGWGENGSIISRVLQEAEQKAFVHFRGQSEHLCGFLAAADLGKLLPRLCENWPTGCDWFQIPPADILSLGEVGDLLKKQYPTLRLSYSPSEFLENTSYSDTVTAGEYGWHPVRHLEQELPLMERKRKEASTQTQQTLGDRFYSFAEKHPVIIHTLELILGFVLMEFLVKITDTTAQFRYVDFRLLYVVLLGTLHGIRSGLAAAALASVSLLAAMVMGHSAWYAVAYDIDTWLPFIFLFLIGAVTGYTKDRFIADNKFLVREKDTLEEKYVLLSEFYASALSNKKQYKTQIVSYQDSFGRLFEISKNLDSTLADEVYAEALHALEGILDNRSVCIYKIDANSQYGRLIACSKEMRDIVGKSAKLTDYPRMTDNLADGEVWVNRERLENYPEYAYPVYERDTLVALILIRKASYEQMAVYYENLVKIVCGLVKISLIRALDFTRRTEAEMYLPGTFVLNADHFARLLETKEKMSRSGTAEHTLIKLDIPRQELAEISARVSTVIRSTDVLGLGHDGQLYLLLSQTNRENAQLVLMRIQNRGIPLRASYKED